MNVIFLDTPSSGKLSSNSLKALDSFNSRMTVDPSNAASDFRENKLPILRDLIAKFSDANVNDIALIPNTSFGLNAILSSLKGASNVLLYEKEYNGLTMPFELRNYSISTFSDNNGYHWDIEEIKLKLIEENIDLFVFSEVQWLSGYRADANELCSFCRENGIISILDLSQSLGSLKFSFSECNADAVLASNYKWMNGGFGSGILWMRNDFVNEHKPTIAGYNSAAPDFDFENFIPNIKCYEPGHLNLHAFSALIPALNEKIDIGLSAIEEHNLKLTNSFIKLIESTDLQIIGDLKNRSSIVVVKNEKGLKDLLDKHQIICKERMEGIRFGFHFHNTLEEVEEAARILSEFSV